MTLAPAIDFRNLVPIQTELARASDAVAGTDELPAWIDGLLRELVEALIAVGQDEWADLVDPYLRVELGDVATAALLALDRDDPQERIEAVELNLEALRDILHDIEESDVGEATDPSAVGHWLRQTTGASTEETADLLGVSKRKLERWLAGTSRPHGDDEMRLVLAARVVNQLRHAMTGRGVRLWFERPLDELDGCRPRDVLAEPEAAPALIGLATQARRSDAG